MIHIGESGERLKLLVARSHRLKLCVLRFRRLKERRYGGFGLLHASMHLAGGGTSLLVNYISTRDAAPPVSFTQMLLAGLHELLVLQHKGPAELRPAWVCRQ